MGAVLFSECGTAAVWPGTVLDDGNTNLSQMQGNFEAKVKKEGHQSHHLTFALIRQETCVAA